jgi:mono/diheme cytochrome c family protein
MNTRLMVAVLLGTALLSLAACKSYLKELLDAKEPTSVYRILPKKSSSAGDPEAGFQYLTEGDYIGGGVPVEAYERFLLPEADTVLGRGGNASKLPYSSNAFTAFNGAEVISGNCFTCHAAPLGDEIVFGLGNTTASYQRNFKIPISLFKGIVQRKVGKDSPEWEAFETYIDINLLAIPNIVTDNPGVNPAFRLEEAYVMQRDPHDLSFTETAQFEMSPYVAASDVPPLWNVKKKGALYYNGMGRGDFPKLLMQASTQGIRDSSAARKVQQRFVDVQAWLESLQPPTWPNAIEPDLASRGKELFELNCSKCHGKYGQYPEYPNKIIPVAEVGTDPVYAQYFLEQSKLAEWYNQSWYALSPPYSELKPSNGYIAPPLDGIWASAPYLHNGSIPTLQALIDPSLRPTYWSREDMETDYDYEAVGWTYTSSSRRKGKATYDTTLPGYGNGGHLFGDSLQAGEQRALLEYLKSL